MAKDNNDDPLMNKKPNSLDRIGARQTKSGLSRDLALSEQRGNLETVEMQKIKKAISDLEQQYDRVVRSSALAKQSPAVEGLEKWLISAGMEAKAARTQATSLPMTPASVGRVIDRQLLQYEDQIKKTANALAAQYEEKRASSRSVAGRQFEQHVIAQIAHPRVGIRGMMSDPAFAATVEKYAEISLPSNLPKGIERASRSRERLGIELAAAATPGNIQTPEGRERFFRLDKEYQDKRFKELALEEAQRKLVKNRQVAENLIGRGERIADYIGERRGMEEIRAGVASGQYGSSKEVAQRLKLAEDAFVSSLGKMREELEKTGKVTASTRKEFEKTSEAYDKQNKIFREIEDAGGGGGRFGKFISGASSIGPSISAAVGLAQYGFVGADMQQLALRAQAAEMTNQDYFDQIGAARGDTAAMRRLYTQLNIRSIETGQAYGKRAVIGTAVDAGVKGAVGIGQAGVAGFLAARGGSIGKMIAGNLAGSAASNVLSAGQGAIELGKGITEASTSLQATGLQRRVEDASYATLDAANKALYDFRMSAYGSMMGAGSRAGDVYNRAIEAAPQLADYGLMPEQTAALFGLGARTIGAQFVRSRDQGAGIVSRGAQLQEARIMSADDYIRRVGQMSNVGGGQKEVEEILANAVRRGVDDAKSLEGLFNMTQMLSRSGAGMGVSTALETQRSLTRGLDALSGTPMNEMLKQALVSGAFEKVQGLSARAGQDIQTIKYFNRIKANDPNIGMLEAIDMAKMRPEIVASLKGQYFEGMKAGEKVSPAVIAALSAVPGAIPTFLTKDLRYKGPGAVGAAESALYGKAMDYSTALLTPKVAKELSDYREGKISYDQLSTEAIYYSGQFPGGIPGIEMTRHGGKVPGRFDPKRPGGEMGAAAKAQRAGAASVAGQIAQAPFSMQEMADIASQAATGADANEAAIRATTAATNIKLDTRIFDESVGDFKTAVEAFVKAVTPLGSPGTLPAVMPESKDQKKRGVPFK
jgi:hypothetical protein